MRDDKRGSIPAHLPPILQRLNIEPEQWLTAANGMERHFYHAIGPVASLEQFCPRLKKRWLTACQPAEHFIRRLSPLKDFHSRFPSIRVTPGASLRLKSTISGENPRLGRKKYTFPVKV